MTECKNTMSECEKYYLQTDTDIEIILADASFLLDKTQRWKSKDLILSWDSDHLEQYIYSAYSPHIENLQDAKHIMKRTMSLMLLYNGSQYITGLNLNYKVRAKSIYGKGFSENLWASEIEEYPFDHNEEFYDKSCFTYTNTSLDNVIYDLTKIDSTIRTLLFLAGLISHPNGFEDSILSWGTLYKIYDTVSYGCKEADIDINTLIPKSKINAFTAACNNMSILGLNSRHGLKSYGSPPKNVISDLEEAVFTVLCLSKNFLIEYILKAHKITYKGEKCNVEDYGARVFSHFSEADREELRKADWSEFL